jgi:hypothetical protein
MNVDVEGGQRRPNRKGGDREKKVQGARKGVLDSDFWILGSGFRIKSGMTERTVCQFLPSFSRFTSYASRLTVLFSAVHPLPTYILSVQFTNHESRVTNHGLSAVHTSHITYYPLQSFHASPPLTHYPSHITLFHASRITNHGSVPFTYYASVQFTNHESRVTNHAVSPSLRLDPPGRMPV